MASLFSVAYKREDQVLADLVVSEDEVNAVDYVAKRWPGESIEILDIDEYKDGETVDSKAFPYSLRLYPARSFFAQMNVADWLVAGIVAFLMLATSFVLWEYHQDRAFERQQRGGIYNNRFEATPNRGAVIDIIPPGGRVDCNLTENGIKCDPKGRVE